MANAVGRTNSTLIALRVIAKSRSDSPRTKNATFRVESGMRAKAAASGNYAWGFLGGGARVTPAGCAAAVAARGGGFGFEAILGGAVASGLASV